MGEQDERRSITTVLLGSVAAIVALVTVGFFLLDAATSPEPSPSTKTALPSAKTATTRQTEASVNVPKFESGAASEPACPKQAEVSVCREVVVNVPSVTIRTVTPYVKEQDTADWRRCEPRGEADMTCGVENFRFLTLNPTVATGQGGVSVSWIAMNSSRERSRDAQLLVEYEP